MRRDYKDVKHGRVTELWFFSVFRELNPACEKSGSLTYSPAIFRFKAPRRRTYIVSSVLVNFSRQCVNLAVGTAIGALLVSWGGCHAFDGERWNLDQYRDEQAVDIEKRLSREKPIVANPF
jgi:hypothetical protein